MSALSARTTQSRYFQIDRSLSFYILEKLHQRIINEAQTATATFVPPTSTPTIARIAQEYAAPAVSSTRHTPPPQ